MSLTDPAWIAALVGTRRGLSFESVERYLATVAYSCEAGKDYSEWEYLPK